MVCFKDNLCISSSVTCLYYKLIIKGVDKILNFRITIFRLIDESWKQGSLEGRRQMRNAVFMRSIISKQIIFNL